MYNNSLERSISWLQHHRRLNVAIVGVYFLLVVLPHEVIGSLIHRMLFRGSVPGYNISFMLVMCGLAIVCLIPFVKCLLARTPPLRTLLGLVLVAGLMITSYMTLMVLATETIHFIQYALLGFLLYPLLQNTTETLVLATGLGCVDEAYQYFWLDAGNLGYLDFNDMILNCVGVGLGLLVLRVCDIQDRPERRTKIRSATWIFLAALALCLAILNVAGVWSVYLPDDGSRVAVVLVQDPPVEYWTAFYERMFHIVQPAEAILILLPMLLAFHFILMRRGSES